MLNLLFKLTTRDPLRKMLIDAPLELIRKGADDGCGAVAEYVRGSALLAAPWRSGATANAHVVWKPKRILPSQAKRGIVAKRFISVDKRKLPDRYYPLSVHFGWHPSPDSYVDPNPWLDRAIDSSRTDALRIFRERMRAHLSKGVPS